MGLSDITSVFSRYFVVGFFLPSYISLVALWLAASSALIPNTLQSHSQATQILILGAVALVAGLVLSGLSYYVARVFEGYPLERLRQMRGLRWIYRAAIAAQRRTYDHLLATRENKNAPPPARAQAAWRLDKWFPKSRDRLLPTRIGNVIRAFEEHSNARWGLDGVTVWPRIAALVGADERELEIDAKTNFYVFTNGSVGAVAVGVCLAFDAGINKATTGLEWLFYVIPFVAAYVLYRAAIGPSIEWGNTVRASIDLHRLDLYEKLGIRAPLSFTDERQLADKVNKALLYAHPLLTDDLWRSDDDAAEEDAKPVEKVGPLRRFVMCITGGG